MYFIKYNKICVSIYQINVRKKNERGPSRMNNPKTLPTLGTLDKGESQTKRTKLHNQDPTTTTTNNNNKQQKKTKKNKQTKKTNKKQKTKNQG